MRCFVVEAWAGKVWLVCAALEWWIVLCGPWLAGSLCRLFAQVCGGSISSDYETCLKIDCVYCNFYALQKS